MKNILSIVLCLFIFSCSNDIDDKYKLKNTYVGTLYHENGETYKVRVIITKENTGQLASFSYYNLGESDPVVAEIKASCTFNNKELIISNNGTYSVSNDDQEPIDNISSLIPLYYKRSAGKYISRADQVGRLSLKQAYGNKD